MSTETLHKFDPSRTMQLVQNSTTGNATACISSASSSGCTISGTALDRKDGAQLELLNVDDYYGHLLLNRWLPHYDMTGVVLAFDFTGTNLQPLESPKFPWNDWPYLDVFAPNGSVTKLPLYTYATVSSGTLTAATGQFTIVETGMQPFDRVTLWYQNFAFDYIVPGKVLITYDYFNFFGTGFVHTLTIGTTVYSYTQLSTDSSTDVANGIKAAAAGDTRVIVTASANHVTIKPLLATGASLATNTSDGGAADTIWLVKLSTVVTSLVNQINGASYSGGPLGLSATSSLGVITITASRGGYDGNMIEMYALSKTSTLTTSMAVANVEVVQFAGGNSNVTWHLSFDFSVLGLTSVSRIVMTFAPRQAIAAAFTKLEWAAVIANISVTDPSGNCVLKVADRTKSVLVDQKASWCGFAGSWTELADNSYFRGYARKTTSGGATVTVEYHVQSTHDLYIGVVDGPNNFTVAVDGGAPVTVLMYNTGIVCRRLAVSGVSAGAHSVVITSGGNLTFDYLHAVVPGDVVDAPEVQTAIGWSLDFDTYHTVSLAPARVCDQILRSGLVGDINVFGGILYLFSRVRTGDTYPSLDITIGGTWADGDAAFITLGGTTIGKSVFPADTNDTIAAHFCYYINETFTAIWASVAANVLTITVRSPLDQVTWSVSQSSAGGTMGTSGDIAPGGSYGIYVIDPAASPLLERAARDYFADFFGQVHAQGWNAVFSLSMDFTNPPDNPPSATWTSRYINGDPADFVVVPGFNGTHCTFSDVVLAFQKAAFAEIAGLQSSAGLTPWLQFGEFQWWYVQGTSSAEGMAFYDQYTAAAASTALGRALHQFLTTNDNPNVNAFADANFLTGQLSAHVAAIQSYILGLYSNAEFELLWARDVNQDTERLNLYLSLPSGWQSAGGGGFSRFKTEALQFGGANHDMNAAREAIQYSYNVLSRTKAETWYNASIYLPSGPWSREMQLARREGIGGISMWALDHFFLRSEALPLPRESRAAF